ncbi:MAG TPA: class I SAM-dependent methyltransferase [Rhodospirillales bacterium]|mgnify:CR=1 FL=1|nr:class I SAM-dependent methyltransferase [Rhodospirillales bacterium]
MTATSTPLAKCQICGSGHLAPILFLGFIPPVNTMPPVGSIAEEQVAYPLELLRCEDCTLVQIGLEVDQQVLFPYSYPYLSGSTRILRENFADLYREVQLLTNLGADDFVVDIGSNDGTLLSNFLTGGHKVLGVDPSQAGEAARQRGIETTTSYFNKENAAKLRQSHSPAKVVTAANVFAHIGDIHTVVEGITELLTDDGIFVSESHYLASLVETLQYDTIYHEHLRYYSLGSLKNLLESHGLEVFHAHRIPTHGGSIRVFAGRKGQHEINGAVPRILAEEDKAGITDGSALTDFAARVNQSKLDLYGLLAPLKAEGARIYGIGAPSRASTLINYVGLDAGILDCVLEISTSHKLGKYIPGSRIPVLDEAKLFEDQPEYALLLSWHIADELIGILGKKGFKGRFIVPLPEPHVT